MAAIKTRSFRAVEEMRARFGIVAALQHTLYRLLNTVAYVEWMHIIVLDRDHVRPLDPAHTARFTSRTATFDDLKAMSEDPRLDISAAKLRRHKAGDDCVLSYVDGTLAGYSWVHTLGRPELTPGFAISVPRDYLYNYAALTLPEFRGLGLQSYRHHQLLSSGLCGDKLGLLGFVAHTNFASRRGQAKSGYRTIGSIWLLGGRRHFVALFSGSLRRMGVRRLPAA